MDSLCSPCLFAPNSEWTEKGVTHSYTEATSLALSFVWSLAHLAVITSVNCVPLFLNFYFFVSAFPSSCIKHVWHRKDYVCMCDLLPISAMREETRVECLPQLSHTHTMLVEPWPSTADIHHDMLPSLVCPFARLMRWMTSINYTWHRVCIWVSVCEPWWIQTPIAAISTWKYMHTAMATVRSHDHEQRLRAVSLDFSLFVSSKAFLFHKHWIDMNREHERRGISPLNGFCCCPSHFLFLYRAGQAFCVLS